MGHLSKEQFAALLDERYRNHIMNVNNLTNSHIDEVHTLKLRLFFIFKQAICSFVTYFVTSV